MRAIHGNRLNVSLFRKLLRRIPTPRPMAVLEGGSLEVGKWADIAILDRNLFEIPVKEIKDVKVKLTMMDGKIVFDGAHDRSEFVEYK
ncbi:amidohydrolase family protein [Terrilactibacillus laevilacticus]|uniref:amidohydrolase family protein n=1 Tax=Terrilactibacillus laevilacticus TaxID=1380157 RepID=UPI001FE64AF4|nr:amidohydrolase family protein [Terrilactibacillus laevilacticus]